MAQILLIDDDEQFRAMLAQMLAEDGHQVTTARDGDEGFRMASQSNSDLIITDILMPRQDGIQMIVALSHGANKVPIVAMSGGRRAISADFNLESATLVGVKATLSKPFTRADLRRALATALKP
jgi:CheY-like chemotaxis protein